MAHVLIPGLLAAQAGGQNRFEVDAATLGDALRALPVADLLFDERGALRPLVNPFVDKQLERDLATPVGADTQVRVVAAIAGGEETGSSRKRLQKADLRRMLKYVVLVAVAALGFAFWQGHHAEAAAQTAAWSRIASELSRRPVTVHCQGIVSAAVDVTAEAGTVEFDPSGRPSDHTDLKRNVCAALARYSSDRATPAFDCVTQNVPCSDRVFDDVQAVHVLAHESAHLGGQESEAYAECQALRTTAYVATRLGSDPAQADAVAQYAYHHLYPNLPPDYQAAGCSP